MLLNVERMSLAGFYEEEVSLTMRAPLSCFSGYGVCVA
jgi:hypothetical protein